MRLFSRAALPAAQQKSAEWFAFDLKLDPAQHDTVILEPWGEEIRLEKKGSLRFILTRGPDVPAIEYSQGDVVCWFQGGEELFVYEGKSWVTSYANHALPKAVAEKFLV